MSLSTGDVIEGKYRIIRLIGEGGMGAVYEGENVRIHRTVAIKVLHAGVAENADAVQRFEREAQAAGRIGSEHIVEVLDLGNLPNGDRFMVMEYLDGEALGERIQARGRLSTAELYPIARHILEGLAAAHGAGIIHRDLKPDNVYLLKSRGGQADFVKLLDFGISKFSALSGESGFSMTRTGAVMGTPYYMSPEQAKGAKGMDHRADLYAVGVILYEAVTGQVPFKADTFNELLFKIVLETPPPIEQIVPDIDPVFNEVIQRAMTRDPGMRFQTAKEFQAALDAWAAGTGVAPIVPMGVTPQPGARASTIRTPSSGRADTGTPGTWANTGGPVPNGEAAARKPAAGVMVAAIAAGVVLLGGGGLAAFQLAGSEPEPPPQPAGPTIEEVRASAAAEAQKAAAEAQKAADEQLKKAEERVRLLEEKAAQQAQAGKREEAEKEAEEAREKAERLRVEAERAKRAAVKAAQAPKAPPKAPPKAKTPAIKQPATTAPAAEPAPAKAPAPKAGRQIRTEL